jgi:hypothetical protein
MGILKGSNFITARAGAGASERFFFKMTPRSRLFFRVSRSREPGASKTGRISNTLYSKP